MTGRASAASSRCYVSNPYPSRQTSCDEPAEFPGWKQSNATYQFVSGQGVAPAVNVPVSALQTANPTPSNKRFLMLIVNGRAACVLEQPELPDVDDDERVFSIIRDMYLNIRNDSPPSFRRGALLLVQRAVTWLRELSRATQELLIQVFTLLQVDWLVWWIGDILFYIPTAANFVKVRSSMTALYLLYRPVFLRASA